MADLDYGAPDEAPVPVLQVQTQIDDEPLGAAASMHAPQAYEGAGEQGADDDGRRRESDLPEDAEMEEDDPSRRRRSGEPRFYQLPTAQGVEASSTRGVRLGMVLPEEEEALLPPSKEDDLTSAPKQPSEAVLDEVPLSRIRLAVLNLSGQPITQLSTSRIFAFLTHCGAAPLGLEWIDDQSCNVVFKDHHASRLALEYIQAPPRREELIKLEEDREQRRIARHEQMFAFGGSAAQDGQEEQAEERGPDPGEPVVHSTWGKLPDVEDMEKVAEQETTFDDSTDVELGMSLLTCRRTRPVPIKLFTPMERENADKMLRQRYEKASQELEEERAHPKIKQEVMDEELPEAGRRPEEEDDRPEIYREMEREELERKERKVRIKKTGPEMHNIERLTSSMYVRFAIKDHDVKPSKSAKRSEWYRTHGLEAGREVVKRLLEVGGFKDTQELLPDQKPPQLEERLGRRGQVDVLDREMDNYRSARERDRSASPVRAPRIPDAPSGIRIKGRGAVRAPQKSVWDDDEDEEDVLVRDVDGGGYLVSDQLEETRYSERSARGRSQRESQQRWEDTDGQGRSLQDRLGSSKTLQERIESGRLLSERIS